MKSNKFLALIVFCLFTSATSYGQASCEVKENYGNIFQFNNKGNVYITFAIFKVEADQLIIDIIKNLRADTITQDNLHKIAKNEGKVFKSVPAGTSEANAALEKARTVFIPAVKENVKESVCWEDVVDNAQKKGQITIQKADENTIRVIIGEASSLLQDFKIIFSETADGIVRVRENGKYAFELATGNCLTNIGTNCKRYDFATDFKDSQALVGEKLYNGKIDYYFINTKGQRTSNYTYTEVTPNFANIKSSTGKGVSKLTMKDGKEVISKNGGEEFITDIYDAIDYLGKTDEHFFLSVKKNKKTGIIAFNGLAYSFSFQPFEVLAPTWLDDIDTLYRLPRSSSWSANDWISVKTGNYWNVIQLVSKSIPPDSSRLVFKGKISHPIRVEKTPAYWEFDLIKSGTKVGLLSKSSNKIVSEPIFDEISPFQSKTGLALVRILDKWGLINKNGKIVLPVEFDDIGIFDNLQHVLVKRNGLWGFATTNGQILLNTIYDKISDFDRHGIAIIELAGKKGCIDSNKKVLFPPQFDEMGEFTDAGICMVKVDNQYGLISKKSPGKEFVEPKYKEMTDLKNGNFFFKNITKKGYLICGIIKPGQPVVNVLEEKGTKEYDVKADLNFDTKCILIRILSRPNLSKVINFEGQILYEGPIENQDFGQPYYSPFYYNYSSKPGFVILKIKVQPYVSDYKILFLKEGNLLGQIYDSYDEPTYIDHQLMKVRIGKKYGCIDPSGKQVIPVQYDAIEPFSALGYTFVHDSLHRIALCYKNGNILTPFEFKSHGSMLGNLIKVSCLSGGDGYLLLEKEIAQTVITCKYYYGGDFTNDFAIVYETDKYNSTGIINASDLIVAPFIFNSIKRDGLSFSAVKDGQTYVLRKSERANLKRLECISGDCALYEKLTKAFFEARN